MTIRIIEAEDTYALRHAVLWPDRPLGYVKLPEDATGQHFGSFVDDQLVSVISLFRDGTSIRFRKFATVETYQGRGIGSALLKHVIEAVSKTGAKSIWCDARSTALPFYQKFGFVAEGDVFYKSGIAYSVMRRAL